MQSEKRPPESVQVHVTWVDPMPKKDPDTGSHVGVILPSSSSVQAPMVQETKFPMPTPRPVTGGTDGHTGIEGGLFAICKKIKIVQKKGNEQKKPNKTKMWQY